MRRFLPFFALLAVAAPLVGCGGSSGVSAELSSVAQAAEKTQDAGTARFELSLDATGIPGQSGSAGFTANGAVDYENQRSQMSMDLGSLGGLLGDAAQGQDLSLEAIVDGTTVYLRFPLLSQLVGQGKPWLKLDAEKAAEASGSDLGELGQISQGDPSQALSYLKAAGDFDEVGSQQVRGVDTTHYTGAIDLRKALDQVDGSQRAQLEKLLDEGVTEIPAEAWIDSGGYLRKMTLAFAGLGATAGAGFDVTMELFDFGSEVALDLPSDDEVTDITELATKGGLTP